MSKKDYTNIIDYIKWRGDLSFKQDPFNDVDALVFARFSYLDISNIVNTNSKEISLINAYELYKNKENIILWDDDPTLFELMANSNRYKDVKLHFLKEVNSDEFHEQFLALVITFFPRKHYISFRGTDNTINGWKEDLLMTFDEEVSSQTDAYNYMTNIVSKLKGDIYLGGHSKGGNLALYATLFCDEDIYQRIIKTYSFDGPGLHKNILNKCSARTKDNKIITYVPQSSIFGRMLHHKDKMVTISSKESGAMQHDIYSWEIIQKDYIFAEEDTAFSRLFTVAFHDYLNNLTKKERQTVVNVIFSAVDECEDKTLDSLTKNLVPNMLKILKRLSNLNDNESKIIKEAINVLLTSFKAGFIDEINNFFNK